MNGFHVDLLLPDERRHQGAVGRRFAITTAGLTLLLLLILLVSWWVSSLTRLEQERTELQSRWAQIEGRYKDLMTKEQRDKDGKAILNELKKWGATSTPVRELLDALPGIVPDGIQLTKLTFRGEWFALKLPPTKSATGATVPVPPVPARKLVLSLDGRAEGDTGDALVVAFDRDLRSLTGMAARCETIEVKQLRRETSSQGKTKPDLQFTIEANFKSRRLE